MTLGVSGVPGVSWLPSEHPSSSSCFRELKGLGLSVRGSWLLCLGFCTESRNLSDGAKTTDGMLTIEQEQCCVLGMKLMMAERAGE